VVNRTNFCTFFAISNFKGGSALKVVFALTPPPRGKSSAKVSSGYTLNSKVINAPLLNFKPIFDPPLKKVVRGVAVCVEKCASKN